MNENIKPFPDDPQARMRRLLKRRMEEAQSNPSERLPEHVHGNYKYEYDPEHGELTVRGPAGVSCHRSRPSPGNEILLDYDGETITYEPAVMEHFSAVNEIFDLLDKSTSDTE